MHGDDQKIENLLNLAMEATQEERQKSGSLATGYDEENRTWQVIVRYSGRLNSSASGGTADPPAHGGEGDLSAYEETEETAVPENWEVVTLSGGYAVITLPQSDVDRLAAHPQVIYVEKPKRLYFTAEAGRTASCVSAVQTPQLDLYGRGVLVAVIDSGVDYFHPDFRNADGSTRILWMWDQTGSTEGAGTNPAVSEEGGSDTARRAGRVPAGFASGVEYSREEINAALHAGSRTAGYAIVPERDESGHGTQVLGIAAGNGRASGGRYRGIASESELIIVKLGIPRAQGFPWTAELMQAVEYVMRRAEEDGRPVAVNISIGNVYGSHRGTSLLETYINMMAGHGRCVISAGTGNEGNTGGHVSGRLGRTDGSGSRTGGGPGAADTDGSSASGRRLDLPGSREEQKTEFLVNDYETSLNIQIWKDYADEFQIAVVHPDGTRMDVSARGAGAQRFRIRNTVLLVYYGEPVPYQGHQEIYLDFIPEGTYLDSGVWNIVFTPVRIVTGEYEMWMADGRARGDGTRFLQPTPDTTLTIPSTAANVIAVGAYDARTGAYAPFSGRGWPEQPFQTRPDLVAPGVDITTTAVGGGYVSVSGTSFATSFVTGAAALLMQWGITDGNDPYLYGEKVRAYLRRGARRLPGFAQYPNNRVGYGALCVRESLPG